MGKCKRHPHRDNVYRCAKHNLHMCRECLVCRDRTLYCKHRPSCPIHFITEKGFDPEK